MVGRAGAERDADELRTARSDAGGRRRDGHGRRADVRDRVGRAPVHRRTTRCSTRACRRSRRRTSSCSCARSCRSRPTTTRTELQAYMIASSDPETYGKLTTYVVETERRSAPRRAIARGQQRRVDRGDLPADLARQRRRRRIGGALRRHAGRAGRRWADLRAAVLRVACRRAQDRRHRSPSSAPSSCRTTIVPSSNRHRGGAGAAVPGLRGRGRRSDRHTRRADEPNDAQIRTRSRRRSTAERRTRLTDDVERRRRLDERRWRVSGSREADALSPTSVRMPSLSEPERPRHVSSRQVDEARREAHRGPSNSSEAPDPSW